MGANGTGVGGKPGLDQPLWCRRKTREYHSVVLSGAFLPRQKAPRERQPDNAEGLRIDHHRKKNNPNFLALEQLRIPIRLGSSRRGSATREVAMPRDR